MDLVLLALDRMLDRARTRGDANAACVRPAGSQRQAVANTTTTATLRPSSRLGTLVYDATPGRGSTKAAAARLATAPPPGRCSGGGRRSDRSGRSAARLLRRLV